MFDKSAAMRTVLLIAILPFSFSIGFFMTPDAPMTACSVGTFYYRVGYGYHPQHVDGLTVMGVHKHAHN